MSKNELKRVKVLERLLGGSIRHFQAALVEIDNPKNPVLDYGLEILAVVMVYNQHIIGTGRDRNLMAKFKYDPDTKTCYMPANTALYAFHSDH